MMFLLLILLRRQPENGMFNLIYAIAVFTFLAGSVLWDRRYRRKWQNYRSQNWKRIEGRFDEGEVIPMMKGRSKTIAGYEIWLGYEYDLEGEQSGLYRLPLKTIDEAEATLGRIDIFAEVYPRASESDGCSEVGG